MSFNRYDPGGCDCDCGGESCVVTVTSECDGGPLEGATVDVYDTSGGTLLDSGTTGPDGTVTLHPARAPGYFEISRDRFTTFADASDPCGGTYALSEGEGYHCACCTLPLPDAIPGTVTGIPGVSAVTLTFGGVGDWTAAVTDSDGNDWVIDMDSGCGGGAALSTGGCAGGGPSTIECDPFLAEGSCDLTTGNPLDPPCGTFTWSFSE